MCTFGTGFSAFSGEGENSTNVLKNCAKTAAKINVRQASELDEFQHVCSGYLEFYTIMLYAGSCYMLPSSPYLP